MDWVATHKSQDVKGILSVEELLVVIDGIHLCLSLRDIGVVVDVIADMAQLAKAALTDVVSVLEQSHETQILGGHQEFVFNIEYYRLEQLVEDMVGPLHRLLLRDTRLLEQVRHNVWESGIFG